MAALAKALRTSPGRLNLELNALASTRRARVLLFIDQFEELYTLVDDASIRRQFAETLIAGADDPQEPVRVIFTLRDDFLGRVAESAAMRRALSWVTVVRSRSRDKLREILVRPVERAGYVYDDPGLVDAMLDEVAGTPGALPLLQFACRTLWERRDRDHRRLMRSRTDGTGGVVSALAEHADAVLDGMAPRQLRAARNLLLALVTPEGTRRLLPRAEALESLGPEAELVLDRLTASRLVSVRRDRTAAGTGAMLELVHESLVIAWEQLARWIDDSRDERALLSELSQAAGLWAARGPQAGRSLAGRRAPRRPSSARRPRHRGTARDRALPRRQRAS